MNNQKRNRIWTFFLVGGGGWSDEKKIYAVHACLQVIQPMYAMLMD